MALIEDHVARLREQALALHRKHHGKIEIVSKVPARDLNDLSLAYTPGVAAACQEIERDPELVYELTARGNLVAVVTDGTAVLGLGDIGPAAAMPVMEGKCVLFKALAGVDAVPLCLSTTDVEEIVRVVQAIEPTFGGINLEDIAAPRCFQVEERLRATLSIPVFHDDQHGSAIVATAALVNALRLVGKRWADAKVVVNGAGAAGLGTAHMLSDLGVAHIVVCDRAGAIYEGRVEHMNVYKERIAAVTNRQREKGTLGEVLRGADVFIGVSVGGLLTREMVRLMAPNAIVMALANPDPEIDPDEAARGGARLVFTGRMDYPNQINNVEAFPGIFRGALDVRAREITNGMKIAAAHAIADLIAPDELDRGSVVPDAADPRVAPAVAAAVADAAERAGVARVTVDPAEVARRTRTLRGRVYGSELPD